MRSADPEAAGDLLVGQAGRDQAQHLLLPRAQVLRGPEHALRHRGAPGPPWDRAASRPHAAARIASRSSSGPGVLQQVAERAGRRARPGSAGCRRTTSATTTCTSGCAAISRRVASTPSSTGIDRSISTTSGAVARDELHRLLAVGGRPDEFDVVGGRRAAVRGRVRTTAWSSTTRTRIIERHLHPEVVPRPGAESTRRACRRRRRRGPRGRGARSGPRRAGSPVPAGSKPAPSSTTSSTVEPSVDVTRDARRASAWAWLSALRTASCAAR